MLRLPHPFTPNSVEWKASFEMFTRSLAEPSERFGRSVKATRDELGLLGHDAVRLPLRWPPRVQVAGCTDCAPHGGAWRRSLHQCIYRWRSVGWPQPDKSLERSI